MESEEALVEILDDKIITRELANFFLGDYIGCGISRYVFNFAHNSKYVVKVDASDLNANVLENDIWDRVKNDPKLNSWFAPVVSLSRCGRIMLQQKCKTGVSDNLYPKFVPEFFQDKKYENWGMYRGKIVCFDYPSVKMFNPTRFKLVKSNFWHDSDFFDSNLIAKKK